MQRQVPQLRFATMRLASGPRVHYAEQGDPSGEPIVFLPAYTDSWFSYSRVLPLLPPRYHAYALDQRGHGDSERPECCYTVEDFAGDVVAFLDAVGVGRATLVGHSGSCLVARRVAEAHPERVARLVLIGSPGSLGDNEEELELQTAVHGLQDPVPVQFARELQGAAAHVPRCSWGVGPVVAAGGGGPAGGRDSRGQGGRVPGDGPQPQLGAPGEGCRRPGRLHARGVADPPPQDPPRGAGRRMPTGRGWRPGMREGVGVLTGLQCTAATRPRRAPPHEDLEAKG
jgi:pimeloyl-ACP methyl ester carboxylesterase